MNLRSWNFSMTENNAPRIKVLPPQEAKRIAAGEVIERPAALVREFLDNAIDSGAANIELLIEEGGCKKVEVCDDGSGMSREDLELCCLTHATSKIRCLDDLDSSHTLGFRGEALAAAAAVSRIEIVTSADGREAFQLETVPTENHPVKIEQTRRTKGTTVRALNLFESIPARKRFLKREGSEGTLCRQSFTDKALAFNNINFRFIQDGKQKCFFPAVSTKKERFAAAILQAGEENFLHEINVTGEKFNAAIVIGGPELYRGDKRQLFVFANGRRVQEYSLIQAMEYGSQGWFPNGTHPVGAVYVEIDPSMADFNIHPAKREVRFRDGGAIHQAVTGGLRNFFHTKAIRGMGSREWGVGREEEFYHEPHELVPSVRTRTEKNTISHSSFLTSHSSSPTPHSPLPTPQFSITELREKFSENNFQIREPPANGHPLYVGRLFGLFILIEWADKLYIIDQHAAHERILYNRFLSEPIPKQQLLAPIPFTTESVEEDSFLLAKRDELGRMGVDLERDGDGWRIDALPAGWHMGDAATVKEILELRTAGENIAERWAATVCCRAAIKDGDYPGDDTAFALGMEALELPDPRCPHGRPIWTEIGKDALFKAVKRS